MIIYIITIVITIAIITWPIRVIIRKHKEKIILNAEYKKAKEELKKDSE